MSTNGAFQQGNVNQHASLHNAGGSMELNVTALAGYVAKGIAVTPTLITNSGFGVCSNSTVENVGDQITVTQITAGVCTTTDTEGLAVGKLVKFGAGGTTANKIYSVTAVTTNTNFTLNDTSVTDATDVTCYEVTPGFVAAGGLCFDTWAKQTNAQVWREHWGTNTKGGSFYSAKVTGGADANNDAIYWPNGSSEYNALWHYPKFAGRSMVFGCWVKSSSANKTRLSLYDGSTHTYSDYHTGGGAWEWLEVTADMADNITGFAALCWAGTSTTAYFSQPMLVPAGLTLPDFSPYFPPIFNRNLMRLPVITLG